MTVFKKICMEIVVSCLSLGLFAQNVDYQAHLAKAKEYESQKKWVYALGEYYDAMTAELSESTVEDVEAYNAWLNISDKISNGNPGLGEYDDFDYVDSWILLLQEYEKYWTENCPKTFYFNKPERTELNRETRTANYEIKIEMIDNPKFLEIDKIIQKGFKKAYKDDWKVDYLKDWPKISVYSDDKYDGKFFIDGTALVSYCTITDPWHPEGGSRTYISDELLSAMRKKSAQKKELTKRYNSALTPIQEWTYLDENHPMREMFNCDYDGSSNISLYDIKFSLRDKSDNILLQTSKYNVAINGSTYCNHVYKFKNISQEIMKLIESGEINCILDEVYLNYGIIDNLVMANERSHLQKLHNLKVENYNSITWLDSNNPYKYDCTYKYDGTYKYLYSNSNKSSVEKLSELLKNIN